ncbi:glycosyltransferase family 9 protein [bacterium]|nr:glycosyltransferase family 9 protein [bacterium]
MKADKKTNSPVPQRILLVRTDRLGDVILSTPVSTAFKRTFPGSFVAMLLNRYTAELVYGHTDVDLVLLDDPKESLLSLVKTIRRHHFDTLVLLHPTGRLALAGRLAGIPVRIGTGYRAYSFLFNRRVYQHRRNSGMHELDLNLQLAGAAGARLETVRFNFTLDEEALQRLSQRLHRFGLSIRSPYIVVHPGSGGSARNWPAASYHQLIERLHHELNLPVLITGTENERLLIDRVTRGIASSVIRVDGKLSIKELAVLLKHARLLISNSTGPLHLAVALGAEVIGLYCPIAACSPDRWGPYHRTDSVLMPEVSFCTNCQKEGCRYLDCMELISVDQVFALAHKKLTQPTTPIKVADKESTRD